MDQRAKPRPDASRYAWLSVGAPIIGLVLLVSLLALFLLMSFAREQDESYARGTRFLVASAVEAHAREVSTLTIDYANWEDAYDNVSRRFSSRWLEDSFYSSVADALIVFRPGQSPRYVWLGDEAPVNVTMPIVDAASRVPGLAMLASAEDPADGAASTYAVVDRRLAIIGVAPITPENDAARHALAGATDTDYLAAVQFLDSVRIDALGSDLHIDGLDFVTSAPADGLVSQKLVAADGADVGAMAWIHAHPGEHGLINRLWIVVLGLLCAGVLTVLIARTLVKRQMTSIVRAEGAVESSRLKSEFIATMSHELRTPLNAIIGYAELIEEESDFLGDKATSLRQDATRIVTAGRHLSQLVNDILDQSKLDAGHLQLQIEPLHAGDLMAEIGEIVEPLAKTQGAQLIIGESEDLVLADHVRLRQCLLNLTGNAVKFTKKGRVTLAARRSVDRSVIIFDVIDTGIGMSADEVSRLFAPFAQVNQKIQAQFGGAGLGLSISRKLARAMGGDLTVISELGKGSTFSLHLPAAAPPLRLVQAA